MIRVKGKIATIMMGVTLMMFGVAGLAIPAFAQVDCPPGSKVTTAPTMAQCGTQNADPEQGGGVGLMTTITQIINVVIFVIGIIAVVMVILGGIRYSTSQGDATKVKSAKDTIMYGIIGLVIAILAFAIVNFVLVNVFNTPEAG